jgi:hypothetical protein
LFNQALILSNFILPIKIQRSTVQIVTLSLFKRLTELIGLNAAPGLDDFFEHSVDIKFATNLYIGNLIALLHVQSEPINDQQPLDHVPVHANLRVHFIKLFQTLSDNHWKNCQQWPQAYEFVPVQVLHQSFLKRINTSLFL